MIQANELRVYNWVQITGVKIKLDGPKFLFILQEDGLHTRCEPIPLTPEILEKAGFVKYKTYGLDCEYKKDEMFIRANRQRFWFEWPRRKDTLPGTTATEFKYVHEIQNLYFALTGKELEINL